MQICGFRKEIYDDWHFAHAGGGYEETKGIEQLPFALR
jgi:hypothetical protein